MDQRKPGYEWKKAELIDRIDSSRHELAHCVDRTARAFNVVEGISRSFRENTWKWLVGAAAAGLVLARARLPGRAAAAPLPSAASLPAAGKVAAAAAAPVMGSVLLGTMLRAAVQLARPYLMSMVQRAIENVVVRASGERESHAETPIASFPLRVAGARVPLS